MNDQTLILQRLLRFPPVESLQPIIAQAFQYKNRIHLIEDQLKKSEEEKRINK